MANLMKLRGSDSVRSIVSTYNTNVDTISKIIADTKVLLSNNTRSLTDACNTLNVKLNGINKRLTDLEGYEFDMNVLDSIKDSISDKQDKLVAGDGVVIGSGNVISCVGSFVVVDELPEVPDSGKIYFVLSHSGEYDQYLWVNNSWKKVGYIDLGGYIDSESEQHIGGIKHFKDVPVFEAGISMSGTLVEDVKSPESDNDAANKKYVDDEISRLNERISTLEAIITTYFDELP